MSTLTTDDDAPVTNRDRLDMILMHTHHIHDYLQLIHDLARSMAIAADRTQRNTDRMRQVRQTKQMAPVLPTPEPLELTG